MSLLHGAVGWSAVHDCGISRSYSIIVLGLYSKCPSIDSEINHIRNFIKIQFVNKVIEFINLRSIYKDTSLISNYSNIFICVS